MSTSFADYIQQYDTSWLRLQQETPQLLSYEDRSLYSTWNISLEHVKQQNELALKLLQLWAYFDNQDVWLELLQAGNKVGPGWFSELTEDRISFDEVIRVLCDHALVEADAAIGGGSHESRGYSMHSCVHAWTIHMVNETWDDALAGLALMCVGFHVPDIDEVNYWVTRQRLLRHADRSQGYMDATLSMRTDYVPMVDAVYNLGRLYADQGKLDKAEEVYELALEANKETLGREHPLTLDTINNLGVIYKDQGRSDKAEEMWDRALEGREKALGRNHTSTLDTVSNLGTLYADQGKLDEAEKMYKWALEGTKALGHDFTSMLDTVSSLSVLYDNQGKLSKVQEIFKQIIEGYKKALRRYYTSTLSTVNNLGVLYTRQGKLVEAEKIFEQTLEGYEKVLGRDHAITLDIVSNLGIICVGQGKLDKAEEMFQRALVGYQKAFGQSHRSTVDSLSCLGTLYVGQGKLAKAEEMYERALEGYQKTLGPDHPRCHNLHRDLVRLRERIAIQ